jgi:hypothetical protein
MDAGPGPEHISTTEKKDTVSEHFAVLKHPFCLTVVAPRLSQFFSASEPNE